MKKTRATGHAQLFNGSPQKGKVRCFLITERIYTEEIHLLFRSFYFTFNVFEYRWYSIFFRFILKFGIRIFWILIMLKKVISIVLIYRFIIIYVKLYCTRERFIICTNRDCAPSFLSQKNYSQLFDFFDYLILIFQDRTSQTIALFLPIFDSIQRTTESFPRYFTILHPRILGINSPIIAKSRGKVYPLDIDGYFDRGFVKMANEISGTKELHFSLRFNSFVFFEDSYIWSKKNQSIDI